MNRAEIRQEVRRILAQTSITASYYTDADLNAWVNDGIRDMCIKGGVYVTTSILTATINQSSYLLPWNLLHIKNILSPSGGVVDEAQIESVRKIFTLSTFPISFYLLSNPITPISWTAHKAFNVWTATSNYTSTLAIPSTPNGYMYECVQSGVTGGVLPTLSTIYGALSVDGNVVWKTCPLASSLKLLTFTTSPNTASGTGNYTIIYSCLDDNLPDDITSPHFPIEKHHYLIPYVCYRAAEKAKQSQLTTAFLTEYASGIGIATPAIAGGQPESPSRST